jgi:hypothetical protein
VRLGPFGLGGANAEDVDASQIIGGDDFHGVVPWTVLFPEDGAVCGSDAGGDDQGDDEEEGN